MTQSVEIIEVSPRDGIQNEDKILSIADKLDLISQAAAAGASRIEVTSFVNPKRVPQMADADDLVAALPVSSAKYIGLALNKRGFDRCCAAGLDEANYVVVASDTFCQKNQGMKTADSMRIFAECAALAPDSVNTGVTIAASFGCPFEGEVPLLRLMKVVEECAAANPFEIALADTIGVATPVDIAERVGAVRAAFPGFPIRLHLHNTRNTGIANAWAGIQAGVTALDASFGGVGGCPFAPQATGNIATEDLLYMLHRAGVETGMSLEASMQAAVWLEQKLEKMVPGMVMKAGAFPATSSA